MVLSGFKTLVQKIPGGQNVQVFTAVVGICGLCAVPVFTKNDKRGHDLFSQEKPEAFVANQEKLVKEFNAKKRSIEGAQASQSQASQAQEK
eukprot:CAMPEP_0118711650 /NCGR_PEP_ID=MMETSP0800-20121206/24239_1 /TAXON_ID=210618 ORGANISM="Striatella unipunctata, Strain CCMP2910" /NCGR_SAMPLE_ID=MMETSP0800 /ASSEMBLY_ACC=CAM_ASM_000638 /LENGTH=90 /DNA_ID=CAMNT_0006616335 /DNA_START=39 /DNA_END=311 /DNA_ORIENTATION=+